MDKALELGFRPIRAGLQGRLYASSGRRSRTIQPLGELIFSEAYARKLVRLSPKDLGLSLLPKCTNLPDTENSA